MTLERLNELPEEGAEAEFLRCCGSKRWAAYMASCRPFWDPEVVYNASEVIWEYLQPHDWVEAFRHHPKIGDFDAAHMKFASTRAWALGEQAGISEASEITLKELAQLNQLYEEKFGYIFIVCATGKDAEKMLHLLKTRLDHHPADELGIAANEQAKITQLRLKKLLSTP